MPVSHRPRYKARERVTPYWAQIGDRFYRVSGRAPGGPLPGWWFVDERQAALLVREEVGADLGAISRLAALHWLELDVMMHLRSNLQSSESSAGPDATWGSWGPGYDAGREADRLVRLITEAVAVARVERSAYAFWDTPFPEPSMSSNTTVSLLSQRGRGISLADKLPNARGTILLSGNTLLYRRRKSGYVPAYTTFGGFTSAGIWLVRGAADAGAPRSRADRDEPRTVEAERYIALPPPITAGEISAAAASVMSDALEAVRREQAFAMRTGCPILPYPTLVVSAAWHMIAFGYIPASTSIRWLDRL